ncbi:DUF58 domain-containing protein [Herbiconiux sp. CPCC 203407]|uniref:DUF58 domain-containing protein n=1 Tax=Herbiconiux oxytropis TaxID=2970915 RepID=A0AA42BU10_9MICO|nr:DUF58 domain-containing protein [Herbiconiux oxytropis]MCS5722589.1 DUF58 domain-containing protein [Herbiconiux oxytropis]MCS5726397.1 DUF58 domain-containing protein [Herbiconiux oxytropis]
MSAPRPAVVVTAGGWAVAALAVAGLVTGSLLGWLELVTAGAVASGVAVASALFLVGRTAGRVEIEVLDRHVVSGGTASVAVRAFNDSGSRRGARTAELAVSSRSEPPRLEAVSLPAVPARSSREVRVEVPAVRRGVIRLGPVVVVRRDPLGLARRESVRSGAAELFVHPATVPLAVRSTGLLRDLEGIPTSDLTDSDMSFHALRPYVAGDDRRHIHWKSTARAGAFLVRQFEQTRRSHLIVVQSQSPEDYASDEEFELVVSVLASIGVRAIADGATVSVFSGAPGRSGGSAGDRVVRPARAAGVAARRVGRLRPAASPRRSGRLRTSAPRDLLDDLSGVEEVPGAARLTAVARAVGESAADASVVFLACGSTVTARQLRAAASHFATGVEVVAVVAEPEAEPALVRIDALRITRIGYLDDLVRALTRAVGV